MANRIVKKKQHTIRFHVDDLMSSHVDKKVNNCFLAWFEKQYGEHGKVKFTRGKLHNFLGMKMDFQTKGKLKVDMTKYMKKMYEDFEAKYILTNKNMSPAANDLFPNDTSSPKLDDEMREDFHTYTAHGLSLIHISEPTRQEAISYAVFCLKKKN